MLQICPENYQHCPTLERKHNAPACKLQPQNWKKKNLISTYTYGLHHIVWLYKKRDKNLPKQHLLWYFASKKKRRNVAKPPPLPLLIIIGSPPFLINSGKENEKKVICRYAMSAFRRQAHSKWWQVRPLWLWSKECVSRLLTCSRSTPSHQD